MTFAVAWSPCTHGFDSFVRGFREIIGVSLGGTKDYSPSGDPTIDAVLSMSKTDDPAALPHRISLSNYLIGSPITSYGCIYRAVVDDTPHYLVIRRKESNSYIDLIHGTYRDSQLFFILQEIPPEERARLLAFSYDDLWRDLHLSPPCGPSYENGRRVFDRIQPYLTALFDLAPPVDPFGTHLFLFPKGRLDRENHAETPFECAKREFREETNGLDLDAEDAALVLDEPVVERYLGTNSKNYETNYFVFSSDKPALPRLSAFEYETTPIRQRSTDENQTAQWVPLDRLSTVLRPERCRLATYIEETIRKSET